MLEGKVYVKRENETAKLPTRGSAGAAGYDLYANLKEAVTIPPFTAKMISCGVSMEIPHGYVGLVYARSGLAVKEGLRPSNCVGVIDEDYRGVIMVSLMNDSEKNRVITPSERIAQIVFTPYMAATIEEVDELAETARGVGGFGSTGTN